MKRSYPRLCSRHTRRPADRLRVLPALLAALLLSGCLTASMPVKSAAEAEATPVAEAADTTAAPDAEMPSSEDPAETVPAEPKGYLLIQYSGQVGVLPLPTEEESTFPLTQMLPDGSVSVNLIHLTPDSVWMEESTCDNHDCIDQGEVTLENWKDRILGNMIICLPNQVVLQLISAEEYRQYVSPDLQAPGYPAGE